MPEGYVTLWLVAYVWTLAIELPIMVLVTRHAFVRWWVPCLFAFGVNTVTHPSLWFLFPRFEPYETWLLVAEGVVWTTEAVLLAIALGRFHGTGSGRWAVPVGIVAAVLANAASTAFGVWVLHG